MENTGYYGLAENCYFIDGANFIVKVGEQPANYRLNDTAAFILRFVLHQVHIARVAELLSQRYPKVEDVLNVVGSFIADLVGKGLLTFAQVPIEPYYAPPQMEDVHRTSTIYSRIGFPPILIPKQEIYGRIGFPPILIPKGETD